MGYEEKKILSTNQFKSDLKYSNTRTIYYGEVISLNDPHQGGIIQVRIPSLDDGIDNSNLIDCYPMLPAFIHIFPKVGEYVRIYLEDIMYPQRSRFWIGSIISQPHKIEFDSIYSALNTTNMAISAPEKAPNTIPDAVGIYPTINDVALIGRVNTDMILRDNDMELRVGKHENNDNLKLNKLNPATIRLTFEPKVTTTTNNNEYVSSEVFMANRIALISHEGNPKFKSNTLSQTDRNKIFDQAHPIARADILVDVLKIFRDAMIQHIHPYSGVPVDKTDIINTLQNIDFDKILQKNVVTN